MNIIKHGKKIYKYESLWRNNKRIIELDFKGNNLPFPKNNVEWQNRHLFITKLILTEKYLKMKGRYFEYRKVEHKDCLIDKKKNITKGFYETNMIRWEDGLLHYIKEHKVKPSDKFIDIIFRFQMEPYIISKARSKTLKGTKIIKKNKIYLKLDKNQILIMDALMIHGSKRSYVDKHNKTFFRYSEHAGLLDFDNFGLEKIIISGKTTRVDDNDNDIFLPKNIPDAFDYEYIFHTHPATPRPGGRVNHGVLYEFPSISDMFHFLDHYNEGKTQGSIIIAAEGLYNIKKKNHDNKKIKINEDKFFKDAQTVFRNVQDSSIKKYGNKFSNNTFYSTIAQNTEYIKKVNGVINKYMLHIEYYPRIKDKKGNWIIDTIYLPIYVIEASQTNKK
jgi:hypothetical protein